MLEIIVPGYRTFEFETLILDYNGTLARDGLLLDGVSSLLPTLATSLKVYVLTADTFGGVRSELDTVAVEVSIIPGENQHMHKLDFVKKIGSERSVCIGNGWNDHLMLQEAALGVAVCQEEGAARESILAADVVCPDILSALSLLTHPMRLMATLRR